MNPFSWMGFDSYTAPKPPKLPKNARFFVRGVLTGSLGTAITLTLWALEQWAHSPYCAP